MGSRAAERLPRAGGTYLLWGRVRDRTPVRIGRLGLLTPQPGWYGYVGSALGPGGLRARLGHHLGHAVRPRWHLDWLRPRLQWRAVWYVADPRRLEPLWVAALAGLPGAEVPLRGFGASDSGSESHLYLLPQLTGPVDFLHRLHQAVPDHPPLCQLTEGLDHA